MAYLSVTTAGVQDARLLQLCGLVEQRSDWSAGGVDLVQIWAVVGLDVGLFWIEVTCFGGNYGGEVGRTRC
jgi:hypothetical protein